MRDQEMRRVLGLTWIGWCNVVLQFLCIRIYRVVEQDGGVSKIGLRWSPIWRDGWSLPTLSPRRPGYLGDADPNFILETRGKRLVVTHWVLGFHGSPLITRSIELGCDLECYNLDFADPPMQSCWRRWLRLDNAIVLTTAGHRVTVQNHMYVPPHARIQDRYPTRRERFARWIRRWRS